MRWIKKCIIFFNFVEEQCCQAWNITTERMETFEGWKPQNEWTIHVEATQWNAGCVAGVAKRAENAQSFCLDSSECFDMFRHSLRKKLVFRKAGSCNGNEQVVKINKSFTLMGWRESNCKNSPWTHEHFPSQKWDTLWHHMISRPYIILEILYHTDVDMLWPR